ncbi:MAG: hypothetical protein M5U34_11895 [Chloroflexi bacterium]|nr:hypothetical protein [Chloroflexota bacterium]
MRYPTFFILFFADPLSFSLAKNVVINGRSLPKPDFHIQLDSVALVTPISLTACANIYQKLFIFPGG